MVLGTLWRLHAKSVDLTDLLCSYANFIMPNAAFCVILSLKRCIKNMSKSDLFCSSTSFSLASAPYSRVARMQKCSVLFTLEWIFHRFQPFLRPFRKRLKLKISPKCRNMPACMHSSSHTVAYV